MMVVLSMVVLVVAEPEGSFWKKPEPTPSPASPPEEAPPAGSGGSSGGDDCGKVCQEKYCWPVKHDPKHYAICLYLCKRHCKLQSPNISDAPYYCTFGCAEMATNFGAGISCDTFQG